MLFQSLTGIRLQNKTETIFAVQLFKFAIFLDI